MIVPDGLRRFLFSFFNWEILAHYLPAIVQGFLVTALLAVLIIATGLVAGGILALLRATGLKPIGWAIVGFADIFRALPPLVIIILLYFALPSAGVQMSGFTATWLSLSLVLAAFAEEIFWAGILSVTRGQWEAARSTGLGLGQTLRHVVIPQALRLTIQPLTNRAIGITKGTALGSVVAVGEILNQATTAQSFSGNPSPLTLGALAYLILFLPFVVLGRYIETRFRWGRS